MYLGCVEEHSARGGAQGAVVSQTESGVEVESVTARQSAGECVRHVRARSSPPSPGAAGARGQKHIPYTPSPSIHPCKLIQE